MKLDPATDILGLIDVQPTFMPGGELPVEQGHAVVPEINRLLDKAGFEYAFATQDWHPPGHASFATTHGRPAYEQIELAYGPQVLWPEHAIQGSPGAALHPDLDLSRVGAIIRKGYHPEIDSYSAFFENDHATPTGLDGYLRSRGFLRLFLVGLATDFCVAWSAEDAAKLGYQVAIIEDLTRGIGLPLPEGGTTMTAARHRLRQLGVTFIEAATLI